jgi:ABC-type nitrate/sulfonate/bicarbonate transport system substrate-binding protein
MSALILASDLMTIEYTPGRIAMEDFYEGEGKIVSGGISALLNNKSIDLGTNAEIPALRNYATHQNLRIIYTVTETYYRIVANKKAGISELKDLEGKRIGTIPGTTSAYFLQRYLGTIGITNYTQVAGANCERTPCPRGSLPTMLASGAVDAVTLWEPTPELALRAIGDDGIVFQNRSVYREIVNLHSTTEKLADPEKRAEIVQFIKALNKAVQVYNEKPESLYERVGKAINVDADVMKSVWPIHGWRGTLAPDLIEKLQEEELWAAKQNNRRQMSPDVVAQLVDPSVLAEALGKNVLEKLPM